MVRLRWRLVKCCEFDAADEPIALRETFSRDSAYHVSGRVDVAGTLTLAPEAGQSSVRTLPIKGTSAIEYDERVVARRQRRKEDGPHLSARRFSTHRRRSSSRKHHSSRGPASDLAADGPCGGAVFADGPLMWNEIDLVRTDVFTPALTGLLPAAAVRVNEPALERHGRGRPRVDRSR